MVDVSSWYTWDPSVNAAHASDLTLSGLFYRNKHRSSATHTLICMHKEHRTYRTLLHSGVCSVSSTLWQYWTFSKLRDWSVWLCRNALYCILSPRQAVRFDRCTKAYKRQSGAGTCEAHWVWIDSCRALRCVSRVGRRLSPRGRLYSCTMLKYCGFNRRPALNKVNVTSIDYSRVKYLTQTAISNKLHWSY